MVSWSTFTASVPAVPAFTSLICVLPALIPVELMTTGPAVTLSKVTVLAVATVMSLPLRVMAMLLPSLNCTVSPVLTKLLVSPLACRLKPALLIALATSPAVARAFGAAGVLTLPLLLLVNALVTAIRLPDCGSTLRVVPSVFAATV